MKSPCAKDREFLARYLEVRRWYDDYRACLDVLRQDHEFLCGGAHGEVRSIRVVLDAYDVIRFCFPFNTGLAFMRRALEPGEQEFRTKLLREHAARACILYGLPSLQPVVVLPAHFAELVAFFETVGRHVGLAAIARELAPLLLQAERTAEKLEELNQYARSVDGQSTLSEARVLDLLKHVTGGFDELAMILMGTYCDGYRILENLLRQKRIIGVDGEAKLEAFFTARDGVLDESLSGARTREAADAGVLAWYRIFSDLRPSRVLRNANDAKVIQEVILANHQRPLGDATRFLIVSGTQSMREAVATAGGAAQSPSASEAPLGVFRRPDVFFYYLQLSEELPPSVKGGPHGEYGVEVHRRNLARVCDELGRLEAFEEPRRLVDKQFEHCGILDEDAIGDPETRCEDDCALRNDGFRQMLDEKLADLQRRRTESEDARSLKKRHPLLATYMDMAEAEEPRVGVKGKARRILDQLVQGASWEGLLDVYIGDIQQLFISDARDIFADLSPFARDLPDRFVDSFFEFPFAVRFLSPALEDAAKALAKLASSVYAGKDDLSPGKILGTLRDLRLAAITAKDAVETDLVRVLLLFAFESWWEALSAAKTYTQAQHPLASEFVLVSARCQIQLFQRNPNSVKPLLEAQRMLGECTVRRDDPRRERLLGVALSLCFLNFPKEAGVTRSDIEAIYKLALSHASTRAGARSDRALEVSILNSWAYFLSHFDEEASRNGLRLIARIAEMIPERKRWYMTWTHTEGALWIAIARHAQKRGDYPLQQECASKAMVLLRDGLECPASDWLRAEVGKDLRQAEALVGSGPQGPEIERP